MIQPRLSLAQEFSIQDLQLIAQFLPLLSQRAMPLFYWTSNLFSIVSGCPLLFWSNNLILADTVLSWFSKRVFSTKVCKPAHSHAPKHTEHWTGGRVGRGFIFLLIKPLKNHTHTQIYIYKIYICLFQNTSSDQLKLAREIKFPKSQQIRFFSFLFLEGGKHLQEISFLFMIRQQGNFFWEREADETLTNPTSQRKAILQKGPQRKGGISFPLQRRWCAMLWEGSLLVGGAQSAADTQAHPLFCGPPQPARCSAYGQGQPLARKKSDRLICIPWDISIRK